MAGKVQAKYSEIYTYENLLKKVIGITPHQYSTYVRIDSECSPSSEGEIPVYALMRVMNKIISESGIINKSPGADDVEDLKRQAKLDHEKLMGMQIANQTKLGILMRKSEMYLRVIKFIMAFQGMMKNIIMITAARMPGIKRDNIIFLTDHYNSAINFVSENTKILNWEADGAHRITQSRLNALVEMDAELDLEIEEANKRMLEDKELSPFTQVNPDAWKPGDPLVDDEESLV